MARIWPFNRRQNNNNSVPPEVKKYYESEHRERVGLAWLVAFLSLLLTIAIVAGLFFGGRWLYRKLAHKKNQPTTISQKQSESATNQSPSSSQGQTTPEPTPSQNEGTSKPKSKSSSNRSSTGSKKKPAAPSQASRGKVIDTGPGSLLTAFIGATALATIGHSIYLRRKTI